MTSSDVWDEAAAARYDDAASAMFAPDVLEPTVDRLAAIAGCGRALELAIGAGRVALPLAARGVRGRGHRAVRADGRHVSTWRKG